MGKGQIYPWVQTTWNPLRGHCPHECNYCYVNNLKNRFKHIDDKYTGELRIQQGELSSRKLPKKDTVFVCSMNDLFAEAVPNKVITKILKVTKAHNYPVRWLWQTKNPIRMLDYSGLFPANSLFGTTIETNQKVLSKAPNPCDRFVGMLELKSAGFKNRMVSIEPVMKFCPDVMYSWIKEIDPDFISIGADSKRNAVIDEPTEGDLQFFVDAVKQNTNVYLKHNIYRIAPNLTLTEVC